jgi:hypothetical protein
MDFFTIALIFNTIMFCNMSKKLENLTLESKYGTYPSESFPNDPRHKPEHWYDICGRLDI